MQWIRIERKRNAVEKSRTDSHWICYETEMHGFAPIRRGMAPYRKGTEQKRSEEESRGRVTNCEGNAATGIDEEKQRIAL